MTRPRRMTDETRTRIRRALDQLAEHADECRPGIRGSCRRADCPVHHPKMPDLRQRAESDEEASQHPG